MGNLIATIKKFISDKNTVTILGVFAGIIVLYIGYNWRVNKTITLVDVIYAVEEIQSNTQITEDMLGTMKVNAELLKNSPNVVRSAMNIKDANGEYFFVNFDSTIPKGSLIYYDSLISKEDKPDSKLKKVPDGFRYVYFAVDLASTLGNAISPGSSIDIYAYINSNNEKMFGKLYEKVNVVDVVDSGWTTTAGSEEKNPDLLIALVSESDYRFLEKAKRISGIELIPAPNNFDANPKEYETEISSFEIQMHIESQFSDTAEEY